MILLVGGDATEAFEDVGHSTDARELMKDYAIGELPEVYMVRLIIVVFLRFYDFIGVPKIIE